MDASHVQAKTDQLELANIQDFLEDKVGFTEYVQRHFLCKSLQANLYSTQAQQGRTMSQAMAPQQIPSITELTAPMLLRNTLVEEAMSPASVDSAYSSSPPTPPLHTSRTTSCTSNVEDDVNVSECTRNIRSIGSPGPSRDQEAYPRVEREGWENTNKSASQTASRDQKMLSSEFFGRQTTKPIGSRPRNKRTGREREEADTDEPHPKPKRKRNRGPKPRVMYEGKGPMQLWQLIISLLVEPPTSELESGLVEWTKEQKYGFRILNPDKLARLWGEHKKKPAMNFDKLARSLRYYYDKSMLKKVPGKENTYEFTWDISEMLGYDPVNTPPVSGTMNVPVSRTVDELAVSDEEDGFPVSGSESRSTVPDPTDSLPVSSAANGLPVSDSVYGWPISDAMNTLHVSDQTCGLSVSAPIYGSPVFASNGCLTASQPADGWPVSLPIGGCPVSGFETPQIPPLTPLDFTMLVESDQKCNFYEVL